MTGLSRCRILIVEDEILLSMALEGMLREEGCEQFAFAATVEDALGKVAEWRPDVVILDLNLQGQKSFPVADALEDHDIAFVIVSGHSRAIVPERHQQRPFIGKPFGRDEVVPLVQQLIKRSVRPLY
ncbi:response regulator [Reyranella sp. CPCC 100927]|uniref:response regulator n=1 Tax=Reyranella sp. CPCC 100927 TaxID=2599616 RepID=UPI0015B5D81C|nr:response regulator [Reyranella sp. CPCC 100927]